MQRMDVELVGGPHCGACLTVDSTAELLRIPAAVGGLGLGWHEYRITWRTREGRVIFWHLGYRCPAPSGKK